MRYLLACLFLATLAQAVELPSGAYIRVNPDDVYFVVDPVDPCEDPTADGCPCPDDSSQTYPSCPTEPPVDPSAPVAVDDSFGGEWAGVSVKANDINANNNSAKLVGSPAAGVLTLYNDGRFIYSAPEGFCGDVEFTYRLKVGSGFSNTAAVSFYVCDGPVGPPVEPPVDPVPVDETVVIVDYTFPPLGSYSGGYGKAVVPDDAPSVTLADGELLFDAIGRLSAATNKAGGRVYVPYDVKIPQCQNVRVKDVAQLAITGIPGPEGKLPRFYCLSIQSGGTVDSGGDFIITIGGVKRLQIEQIEVAGWTKFVSIPNHADTLIRNAIFYGAKKDGFGNNGVSEEDNSLIDTNITFAGVKVYNSGQGNASHCFYMHRGNDNSDVIVTLVDSEVASCNWSSGFKSIAEFNTVINNKFYKFKDIDGLPRRFTQMMVDVAACGSNTIEGNYFGYHRPDSNSPGNAIIGVRNRRGIFGCDIPRPYHETCVRNPLLDGCKVEDSDYWKKEYWAGLGDELIFSTKVQNNTVEISGYKADKASFISSEGTYPNYTYTLGGWDCPLELPDGWYERSIAYSDGNIFSGDYVVNNLYNKAPVGNGQADKCEAPLAEVDRSKTGELISVGITESYK